MKRSIVTLAGLLLALSSLHPAISSPGHPLLNEGGASTTGTAGNIVIAGTGNGAGSSNTTGTSNTTTVAKPLPGAATTWKIAEGYSIKFDGKGASGTLSGLKGAIVFDEKDPGGSHFNVTVSTATINTGNNLKNKHVKSEKYLDVEKFPLIKFSSSSIKASGNGYTANGTLEIHGVKKQISMPFQFKSNGNGGTFTANIEISRKDYKIGSSSWLLGDDFKVEISVPVTK
ncbi:YceI family protein [Chitinophaga agrisoli]|nr:YceI family protein [Chitinophaga agrisoli]